MKEDSNIEKLIAEALQLGESSGVPIKFDLTSFMQRMKDKVQKTE